MTVHARFDELVSGPAPDVDRVLRDVTRRIRRQRRRRNGRRLAVVAAAVVVAAAAVPLARDDGGDDVTTRPARSLALLTVGWDEGPRLADPETFTITALGESADGPWCNTCPLVAVGDRVYSAQNGRLLVFEPEPRDLGAAGAVLATAEHDGILVQRGQDQLVELSLDGQTTVAGPWTLPDGYGMTFPPRTTEAGILVAQQPDFIGDLAIWDPTTGELRSLGRFNQFVDARPGVGIAWTECPTGDFPCSLVIAGPDGTRRHVIPPPIAGNGFYGGAAFSPDGRTLAVTLSNKVGTTDPSAMLALVDVATGQVAVVEGSAFGVGEPYGFAAWSPDGSTVFFTSDRGVQSYEPATDELVDLPFPGTYYDVAVVDQG